MIGAGAIAAMRIRGWVPGTFVQIWLDETAAPMGRQTAEVVIEPTDAIERLDLRFLVGLDVSVTVMRAESAERADLLAWQIEKADAAGLLMLRHYLPLEAPNYFTSTYTSRQVE